MMKKKEKRSFKPLISVITATYNAGKTLPDLINSIRLQSYKDFEFIIIDGDSNDNTLEIIISNLDIISYWISEKDNGIYDAWNKGILHAHGEWISFIGADDVLKFDSLKLYEEIITNQTDSSINFISAKAEIIYRNTHKIHIIGRSWHPLLINVCHVMALHKVNLYEVNGVYNTNYKIVGDYEFLLRCRKKIKPLFVDKVVVGFGYGGKSNSYSAINEIFIARIKSGHINPFYCIVLYLWNISIYTFNNCIRNQQYL